MTHRFGSADQVTGLSPLQQRARKTATVLVENLNVDPGLAVQQVRAAPEETLLGLSPRAAAQELVGDMAGTRPGELETPKQIQQAIASQFDHGGSTTTANTTTASIGGLSVPIIAAIAILVGVAAWLLGGD